tara:strand:- start:943 stop:1665 length:723 start_codon:yes stop_codon:yes gene_type:complete
MKVRLGINIDHVATIRNARGEKHPDPFFVARHALKLGADSITIHLREDRRHINDKDLKLLSAKKNIPLNLEIAVNPEMLKIAIKAKPNFVCIVPEKRNEITTEGGLNLKKNLSKIKYALNSLKKKNIRTSLFIDPSVKNIHLSNNLQTQCVEIHTGKISNLIKAKKNYKVELKNIKKCAILAKKLGLEVHAGHGLDYKTAKILSNIKEIEEFNIGHFIIGESITLGLRTVINKFLKVIKR